MIIRMRKNITCGDDPDDSDKCCEEIYKKVYKCCPELNPKNEGNDVIQNGYISIRHINGDHHIFIVIFDKDGKREMPCAKEIKTGEICPDEYIDCGNAKKFIGKKPTQEKLEEDFDEA